MTTLAKVRSLASIYGLIVSKDKGMYRIEEDSDSPFVCRCSAYELDKIEKQVRFYAINKRFSNNAVKRDLLTGQIIWRR